MALEKELEVAMEIVRAAGELVMKYYQTDLEVIKKEDDSPLTIADQKSNELIVQRLHDAFPQDGIVSEELASVEGDRKWYVDPIDGTESFARKEGSFAIHIGLAIDQSPVLGLVYHPPSKDLYYGIKGVGAFYRNLDSNKERKLMITPPVKNIFIMVDSDHHPIGHKIRDIINPTSIVTCGSEGLRLMKIVDNLADVRVSSSEFRIGTWDTCAPQALVEAAGGFIRYFDGSRIKYMGQGKIAQRYICTKSQEQFESIQKKIVER